MTDKYKIGYKVVWDHNGCFVSVMAPWHNALLEYSVGKRTTPKDGGGPLAVFADVISAACFIYDNGLRGSSVIFKCCYKPSKEKAMWQKPINSLKTPILRLEDAPHGTKLAGWVKLLPDAVELPLNKWGKQSWGIGEHMANG